MERLKQTYSREILEVMKMSNVDGLKQHYRCHKDKRAKTIKLMASVTDPARLIRLQCTLDKRVDFLDERDGGGGGDDEVVHTEHVAAAAQGCKGEVAVVSQEEASEQPPPAKQLRLSDFKEDMVATETKFEEYDANRMHPGEEGDDDDAFLDDFVPGTGAAGAVASAGPKDNIHHFFEFLKSEVRELPKARQCMIMDSFFIQLTEARKWN